MYTRYIKRSNGKLGGPYLYMSVRSGNTVTGKYMGLYDGRLMSAKPVKNSIGVGVTTLHVKHSAEPAREEDYRMPAIAEQAEATRRSNLEKADKNFEINKDNLAKHIRESDEEFKDYALRTIKSSNRMEPGYVDALLGHPILKPGRPDVTYPAMSIVGSTHGGEITPVTPSPFNRPVVVGATHIPPSAIGIGYGGADAQAHEYGHVLQEVFARPSKKDIQQIEAADERSEQKQRVNTALYSLLDKKLIAQTPNIHDSDDYMRAHDAQLTKVMEIQDILNDNKSKTTDVLAAFDTRFKNLPPHIQDNVRGEITKLTKLAPLSRPPAKTGIFLNDKGKTNVGANYITITDPEHKGFGHTYNVGNEKEANKHALRAIRQAATRMPESTFYLEAMAQPGGDKLGDSLAGRVVISKREAGKVLDFQEREALKALMKGKAYGTYKRYSIRIRPRSVRAEYAAKKKSVKPRGSVKHSAKYPSRSGSKPNYKLQSPFGGYIHPSLFDAPDATLYGRQQQIERAQLAIDNLAQYAANKLQTGDEESAERAYKRIEAREGELKTLRGIKGVSGTTTALK